MADRGGAPVRAQGGSTMADVDFKRLSAFIQGELGIRMPEAKRLMLESRLQKRLRKLGFGGFSEYIDYVFSPEGRDSELINMIDAVTTNKTDFFREADHFEYLAEVVLPAAAARDGTGRNRPLTVWSAGCSTGEEPYTIAMVLEEARAKDSRFSYRIFASDLSTQVLEKAELAVYEESKVAALPLSLKKKYMLKSKDREGALVRMKPEMRSRVAFGRINLMDDGYRVDSAFDVVFCRNVLIYFERAVQESIILKLHSHIRPGGWLFLGHSETLAGLSLPFRSVAPTIYERL
jgi:chemotaxis protein methyltransferase CheR